jgi:hypothetical protein
MKSSFKDFAFMQLFISTGDAVLKILYHIQEKYNVTYSQVKRATIQKQLWKFYKIKRTLSTIDYHLGKWKKAGAFNTYQRRGRDESGRFFNLASNRQIVAIGFNYLLNLGTKVAKDLLLWAYKGIKPKTRRGIKPASKSDQMFPRSDQGGKDPPETIKNTLSTVLDHLS